MKKLLLAFVFALAATSAAFAERRGEIAQSGMWTAFYNSHNTQRGSPVCGVETVMGEIQFSQDVQISWDRSGQYLHLGSTTWNVPANARVPVEIIVDQLSLAVVEARVHPQHSGTLVWKIPANAFRGFMRQFMDGHWMTVRFLHGSEAPWTVDLTGSEDTGNTFLACIDRHVPRTQRRHTQPFHPFNGFFPFLW